MPSIKDQIHDLHRAFNVAIRRVHGTHMLACDGDDCAVCEYVRAREDVKEDMRKMIGDARLRFLRDAQDVVGSDDRLRALAWGLLFAIGEVSPEDALQVLYREKYREVPS